MTKTLEDGEKTNEVVDACNYIRNQFIQKVRHIVSDDQGSSDLSLLNKNLEYVFGVSASGKRTQQNFYALWHFLSKISEDVISKRKQDIRKELSSLF